MEEIIAAALAKVFESLIVEGVKYTIKSYTDSIGNGYSQFVALFDDDEDGTADREETLYTFDVSIPDLSDGYCIVNKDDEIGLGLPELELVDSTELSDILGERATYSGTGFKADGDVYIPLPLDYNSDGSTDFGRVIDSDNNGVPDASDDAPFYPVGSDEFNNILQYQQDGGKSFIICNSDGSMTVYDENGTITAGDCETAYNYWVAENGIMNKPLDYYTVTEGLLFLTFVVSLFGFFGNIFRQRRVMR